MYQIGDNISKFHGRYHTGSGFFSDAFRNILPILKNFGRTKLQQFSSSIADELGKGQGFKEALKTSAKSTALKALRGEGRRKKVSAAAKPIKRRVTRKRKSVKRATKRRSKADFFDII